MALQMSNIQKAYGQQAILKGVDFSVENGEIHALLGMNGAGKSTLMKILTGQVPLDYGSISIDGKKVTFNHPRDAQKEGIGIVVQEVDSALFPDLTIAENLVLSSSRPFFLWKSLYKRTEEVLSNVNLPLSPNMLVKDCSLQEKQLLLIAKVLSKDAKYIILDEPTASLSEKETRLLFSRIHQLKKQGISTIFISHRLEEVQTYCEKVTILRDGRTVYSGDARSLSIPKMIEHMVGNQVMLKKKTTSFQRKEKHLSIRNLTIKEKETKIHLDVYKGEIVGIGGLAGSGKTELAESIFGLNGGRGTWMIHGTQKSIHSPYDALKAGICLIPEERRKQGLFLQESSAVNLTVDVLKTLFPKAILQLHKEKEIAREWMKELNVSPNIPDFPVSQLSGGNQQKIVIGKWLQSHHEIYLFDEPTKGIDVQAKQEIFTLIQQLAKEGKSILYFSSEWDELLQLCDRIIVLKDGVIAKSVKANEATYETLLYYATMGGNVNGANRESNTETRDTV